MTPRTPPSTLFPYTTLFRSRVAVGQQDRVLAGERAQELPALARGRDRRVETEDVAHRVGVRDEDHRLLGPVDRKSTRLNSSHVEISYAVFCLKKKKQRR